MSSNSPADNIADLAKTLKEVMTKQSNFESQLKAQSEEIRTLRDKNENLEKYIKDLDDVKEDYNKLKDDHGQLKGNYVYEVASLKAGIDKLQSGLPSPSTPPPPFSPTSLHPNQRPQTPPYSPPPPFRPQNSLLCYLRSDVLACRVYLSSILDTSFYYRG